MREAARLGPDWGTSDDQDGVVITAWRGRLTAALAATTNWVNGVVVGLGGEAEQGGVDLLEVQYQAAEFLI